MIIYFWQFLLSIEFTLFISTLILDIYFQNIYLHKLINVHHSDLMLMHKHLSCSLQWEGHEHIQHLLSIIIT